MSIAVPRGEHPPWGVARASPEHGTAGPAAIATLVSRPPSYSRGPVWFGGGAPAGLPPIESLAASLLDLRHMHSPVLRSTALLALLVTVPASAHADHEGPGAEALAFGFVTTEIAVNLMALHDLTSDSSSDAYAIAEIGVGGLGVLGNGLLTATLASDPEIPGGWTAIFAAETVVSLIVAVNGVQRLTRDEPTQAGTRVAPLVIPSHGTTAAGLGVSGTF